MGNKARQNRRKKEMKQSRAQQDSGTMRQLRLGLANMRQLYEQAVQEKLGLKKANSEMQIMLAAVLLTENTGDGTAVVGAEALEEANGIDGISVSPDPEDDTQLVFALVRAPVEEEEAAYPEDFNAEDIAAVQAGAVIEEEDSV